MPNLGLSHRRRLLSRCIFFGLDPCDSDTLLRHPGRGRSCKTAVGPHGKTHLTCQKIAIHEATPYDEIRQNPYTVLCVTSMGGHLSWFEFGGGRWHAKPVRIFPGYVPGLVMLTRQVANFLKTMASEIETVTPEPKLNAETDENGRPGITFNAMRRKLEIRTT